MHSTLDEYLALLARRGDNPLLPTPPAYAALWERARAAGLRLGRLYVVRRALAPDAGGGFSPTTGDIWVYHGEAMASPERGLLHLLHELAHAKRGTTAATSVDADWSEEAETFREAQAFVRRFGLPDLVVDVWLVERLVVV